MRIKTKLTDLDWRAVPLAFYGRLKMYFLFLTSRGCFPSYRFLLCVTSADLLHCDVIVTEVKVLPQHHAVPCVFPEKGQVYKQKKPTMYPPWSTTFDAHVHRGRIMHVMVKDRTAELKSEATVALDTLATRCKKENGKLEIWVSADASPYLTTACLIAHWESSISGGGTGNQGCGGEWRCNITAPSTRISHLVDSKTPSFDLKKRPKYHDNMASLPVVPTP